MEITVLGVGAFAVALAKVLCRRGHSVTLWCHDPEIARGIAEARESPYLPGIELARDLVVTDDMGKAVSKKPVVVCVVASPFVRLTSQPYRSGAQAVLAPRRSAARSLSNR